MKNSRTIWMTGWTYGLCMAVGWAPLQARAEDDHAGHAHGEESAAHENEAKPVAPAWPKVTQVEEPQGREDAEHDDHEEEGGVRLTPEQRERFGIVVARAEPGSLTQEVILSGEVTFNEDRVVHLVPRVAGIVREVSKTVGDRVEEGERLVVMDSRELADAKAEYLAAKARLELARTLFEREGTLREQKVSSEQDYLHAQQALAEARIVLKSAEQKLRALGYDTATLTVLEQEPDVSITRYELRAPIAGTITARHAALGESLEATSDIFTMADLSSVWVNLTVYPKDLDVVRPGQPVDIRTVDGRHAATGTVAMVTPFVDPATRSALARVALDNAQARWVPGTFVRGFVRLEAADAAVVVPRDAIQTLEGQEVVFIEHEGAFEATPVKRGRSDRERVEVVSGLAAGTPYVAGGAFNLKATVVTSGMDSHAGHGH